MSRSKTLIPCSPLTFLSLFIAITMVNPATLAYFIAVALGFDETHFLGEAVESVTKGRAEACVLTEIEHSKVADSRL